MCVPALATCFPRAFRLICARSACCAPSCPPHFRRACPPHFRPCAAPLSRPSLATPPSPSSACSRSSRAYSRSFRVFLRSRVPPRAFAPCCCAASLTPPISPRALPVPLPVQAPCRTRDVAPLASGVAAVHVRFCTTAAVLLRLRSPHLRALTPSRPHALLVQAVFGPLEPRSLHLRVPWLFMYSLRCWRSALARQCRLQPLHRLRPHLALRRLAISATAALCSSAPLARTVLAALR